MRAANIKRSDKPVASVLLMLLALLWLSVSAPFVYACQQQVAVAAQKNDGEKTPQSSNPLSGTDEEKSGPGSSNVSEYLHQTELPSHVVPPLVKYKKCRSSSLYLAFTPDLLCPPPNTVGC